MVHRQVHPRRQLATKHGNDFSIVVGSYATLILILMTADRMGLVPLASYSSVLGCVTVITSAIYIYIYKASKLILLQ